MTAFNENNLNDQNENLGNLRQGESAHADQLGENTGSSALESKNPYTEAENPAGNRNSGAAMGNNLDNDEAYGENAGIINADRISNSDVAPGPGDNDDDLDDDDDLLDDDDDDTLIPIEGDEEDDSLLSADDDDDVIPGTDMDDGDDLLDDDDDLNDDDDSGINRSTTGHIGTDFSRNDGRTTGRMIDHEPGTGGI